MKYLVHADGKLPNLALMRLSTYFKSRGSETRFMRGFVPRTPESPRGEAFGSSIFSFSNELRNKIDAEWAPATGGGVLWGGTGVDVASSLSSVDSDVSWDSVALDYSLYDEFQESIGFLTRGCRLRCGFCVVPAKEGKPYAVASVHDIWRGEPYPRHLHLLDNDAFAPQLADHWRRAAREIRDGGFRICFSQGINLRLVNEESAGVIASLPYYATDFVHPQLYTAWDSIGDEAVFRRGVKTLSDAGVKPANLTVFMLVGYSERETWEEIFYRLFELAALGCRPYPMVFNKRARPDLCAFARWAIWFHGYKTDGIPWPEYRDSKSNRRLSPEAHAESVAAWKRVRLSGWKPKRRLEMDQ